MEAMAVACLKFAEIAVVTAVCTLIEVQDRLGRDEVRIVIVVVSCQVEEDRARGGSIGGGGVAQFEYYLEGGISAPEIFKEGGVVGVGVGEFVDSASDKLRGVFDGGVPVLHVEGCPRPEGMDGGVADIDGIGDVVVRVQEGVSGGKVGEDQVIGALEVSSSGWFFA